MVDRAYYTSRIIGLTGTFICIIFSILQIILYHKLKNKKKNNKREGKDIKYYVHYLMLVGLIINILLFSDCYSALGIIPFLVQQLIANLIEARCTMISGCIIIYQHFSAHYRTLKREMPKFFVKSLSMIVLGSTIGHLISQLLENLVNPKWFLLTYTITWIWLITIIIVDLYGYYLVRNMILEVIRYQNSPNLHIMKDSLPIPMSSSQPQPSPTQHQYQHQPSTTTPPTPNNNYHEFLSRIWRFHAILTTICVFYILFFISNVASGQNGSVLPPNPNHFNLGSGTNLSPYIFFITWGFLTWWSWIPLKNFYAMDSEESHSHTSTHTNFSHKKTELSEEPERGGKERAGGGGGETGSIGERRELHSPSMSDQILVSSLNDPSGRGFDMLKDVSHNTHQQEELELSNVNNSNKEIIMVKIAADGQILSENV